MKIRIPFIGTESGVTLLEMVVSLGVLGVVLSTSAHFIGKLGENSSRGRVYDTHKRLAGMLKNAVESPSVISFSLTKSIKNRNIAKCLLSMGTKNDISGLCKGLKKQRGGTEDQHEMVLFQQNDSLGTSSDQISGMYYDVNGEVCEKGKKSCIFYAETKFYIRCIDVSKRVDKAQAELQDLMNAGLDQDKVRIKRDELEKLQNIRECGLGPDQVHISYQVRQVSAFNPGKTIRKIPKQPRYITLSSRQILGPDKNSQCGSGAPMMLKEGTVSAEDLKDQFPSGYYASLVGYEENGNPICKCLYPFVQIPNPDNLDADTESNHPLCRLMTEKELSCDPDASNSYLRGINDRDEGKEVLCVNEEDAFECSPRDPHTGCPEGSWINAYESESCEFQCDYIPDMVRTCSFQWSYGKYMNDDNSDNIALDGFGCSTLSLECCHPARFKDKWYDE